MRERVLESIKSGRVVMRPRWHFVLKAVLLAVGGSIIFLAILYLVSFTLFILRRTGILFVPSFGARGWYVFLVSLPWILILVSLVFILVLEVLVRQYAFAYRRPLLYSLLGIILLVFLGGFIVDSAHVQGRFSRFAEEHRVPFARDFYRQFQPPRFGNVHGGNITEVASSGFVMKDMEGDFFSVIITPRTRLPLGADFSTGDSVVVFGDIESTTIQAFGVREMMNE